MLKTKSEKLVSKIGIGTWTINKENFEELLSLAQKYGKTQNQVLINWIVKHKQIGVLIKSSNKEHIKENISFLDFDMEEEDYKILDSFRSREFDEVKVSFKNEEGKVRIDQLPNQKIGVI